MKGIAVASSRNIQFSVRSLLIFTSIAAAYLFLGVRMEFSETYFMVTGASLFAATGFLFGWLGRIGADLGTKTFIPATIFIVLNWSLWYFNGVALRFVDQAHDRDLTPAAALMVDAYRNYFFDVMAIVFFVVIAFVAISKNGRLLFLFGTLSVLTWLLIFESGYVFVSISMLDLH